MNIALVCRELEERRGGSLARRFGLWRRPFALDATEFCGHPAWRLTLPRLTEEEEAVVLPKAASAMAAKEVGLLLPLEQMTLPVGFLTAATWVPTALYAKDALLAALEETEVPLKDAKIVILDGGDSLTQYLIDQIYPVVNFLSVLTAHSKQFEQKAEDILADCGLCLQVFSSYQNPLLREADIILNAALELENFDYYFKTGATYLNLRGNMAKERRLRRRREDMGFGAPLFFCMENRVLTSEEADALCYLLVEEYAELRRKPDFEKLGENARKALQTRDIKLLCKD